MEEKQIEVSLVLRYIMFDRTWSKNKSHMSFIGNYPMKNLSKGQSQGGTETFP